MVIQLESIKFDRVSGIRGFDAGSVEKEGNQKMQNVGTNIFSEVLLKLISAKPVG